MYAQSNYPNVPMGIPPTKYSIKDIGCFITSFCNLASRYDKAVDPPAINAFFRDNKLYVDIDDGVRDDVSWDFITKYDSNIVVTATGLASTPPHNNCIVKFIYNGGKSTHFCLVNDINNGTIIDSWDGAVKSWNVYGGVKAWASYTHKGEDMAEPIIENTNKARMIMLDYGLERPGNDPFLLRAVGQTEREFRASLAATIKHTFDVQNEAIETLQKQLGKKYVPYSGPPLLVEDK